MSYYIRSKSKKLWSVTINLPLKFISSTLVITSSALRRPREFEIDSNITDERARKSAPLRRSVQIPQHDDDDDDDEEDKSCTGSLCSRISNAFSGGKTKKRRRKRRKSSRKRKRKTRRKSKNKTRRKSGRGIGPSKIAKVGVAALAASSVIGQGMGHGISPSRGTPAAVNHFNTVACSDFHIRDIVEHSEDHGQPTKHYRQVLKACLLYTSPSPRD